MGHRMSKSAVAKSGPFPTLCEACSVEVAQAEPKVRAFTAEHGTHEGSHAGANKGNASLDTGQRTQRTRNCSHDNP